MSAVNLLPPPALGKALARHKKSYLSLKQGGEKLSCMKILIAYVASLMTR